MKRPSVMLALVAIGALAPLSQSYGMPVSQKPNDHSYMVREAVYCPPGYKVTSHDGCKLSHYLKKHPGKQYQARPQYYDNGRRDGGYYDNPPPPRRYYDHRPSYYDNGDDGNY